MITKKQRDIMLKGVRNIDCSGIDCKDCPLNIGNNEHLECGVLDFIDKVRNITISKCECCGREIEE